VSGPFLRRRLLISGLQYRLLVVNLLYYFAIVLIFAVVLFLPLILQLQSATSPEQNEQAAVAFLFLHARLWPALLLVLALLAFHSVIVSHRVAGPLYRFQCVWKAVAEGDLSVRARLRKNDYLKREADVINEMIEALTKRITGIEEQSRALRAVFDDLQRAREDGATEALHKNVRHLGVLLDDLKTSVAHFRVGDAATEGFAPMRGSASVLIKHE
jgi:methyl-accepting chemotaxis protein